MSWLALGVRKSPGAGFKPSRSGRRVLVLQEGKAAAAHGGGGTFLACLAKSWLHLSRVSAVCPSFCFLCIQQLVCRFVVGQNGLRGTGRSGGYTGVG